VIRRAFAYVFDEKRTLSSIPSVKLHVDEGGGRLSEAMGVRFVRCRWCMERWKLLGYRVGRAAYLTISAGAGGDALRCEGWTI